jgi:hypothetical protein
MRLFLLGIVAFGITGCFWETDHGGRGHDHERRFYDHR